VGTDKKIFIVDDDESVCRAFIGLMLCTVSSRISFNDKALPDLMKSAPGKKCGTDKKGGILWVEVFCRENAVLGNLFIGRLGRRFLPSKG